ncbi:zinc finger MYND domain-containing protein 11-like isoform X3 [Aphidius gifuensis]|nr:zinc finger MYND domain-containing protein 11-like isoform X3 [Aphidius gifuensis]
MMWKINMSIRRSTDPEMTQKIWDGIKITIHQRNSPTSERLIKHFVRVYGSSEKSVQEELDKAVNDGLIILKKGNEQDSYKLPLNTVNYDDDYDWYCFKCQDNGFVEKCVNCFRVYHTTCYSPTNSITKLCEFCEKISTDSYDDIEALNHILGFTCGHLKAKLPPEITNRTIIPVNANVATPPGALRGPTWISEGEDSWRPDILIKNHMDLAIMEAKTLKNEYTCLAEFQADAHNILHNIIIYHGENSAVGEMGVQMYDDCCYDLKEIRRCADCYKISNEKAEKMWFCIPCNPPHKLVYAKQKGYPYWPAKVMEVKDNVYDVRFFGGHHMRANIEKVFIRPITASLQSLQIKRSTAWNRAFDELKYHQNLLSKSGNNRHLTCDLKDDGPKPAKIRKTGIKVPSNGASKIIKDLRVKVARLTSGGLFGLNQDIKNEIKSDGSMKNSSRSTSEERQVPLLPVAEDEPTAEIFGTCPSRLRKEGSQEDMVTSSCQEPRSKCVQVQTDQTDSVPAKVRRERRTSEQPTTTNIEKLRREMEYDKCRELEQLQADHAAELRQLTEKHQQVISEIKKKQWCYNCENEAIYHCCWNTAYCSTDCQQIHWQREHKRICRRKR